MPGLQDTTQVKNYQQELVSLLAACAEGDDRYIESMCQTILGLDDVLHILNNNNIRTANKCAYIKFVSDSMRGRANTKHFQLIRYQFVNYCRFLLYVYIKSSGDPLESWMLFPS